MLINGIKLRCPHCKGDFFTRREAQFNAAVMGIAVDHLALDWPKKTADAFVCQDCGRIEWFLDATVEEDGSDTARDCPRCGTFLEAGVPKCPNCAGGM